jgi:X-Pro dipeptidyl-peptidase
MRIPERCTHLVDEALQQEDRKTGDYSPFWAAREIPTALAVAPALVAQGLTDDNVRTDQSTSWYLAMRRQHVPTQLWLHRLKHTDPTRVPAMANAWPAEVNRWFTRYLIGVDNGVERDPRAVIEQPDGTLLKEADWAARHATPVAYFAGGDGTVSARCCGYRAAVRSRASPTMRRYRRSRSPMQRPASIAAASRPRRSRPRRACRAPRPRACA